MDVFDKDFQEFIMWKMGEACKSIENKSKWDIINSTYDMLHDTFYNSLNEEQKLQFNNFLQNIWEKVKVELCVTYKMGLTDKEGLKKYESNDVQNIKNRGTNNE